MVTAVGPGLTGRKVGDVVVYAHGMGSYAEEQILPADKAVPVPSSIDPKVAASAMLKGMTVQYLVRRCFKVRFIFACQHFYIYSYILPPFQIVGFSFLNENYGVSIDIPLCFGKIKFASFGLSVSKK